MPTKKTKKIADKTHSSHYWKELINNFYSHSKMWLEDFETSPQPTEDLYFNKKNILDKSLAESIKKFCLRKKITAFTLINAAWALLLNRYTSADDIIYGISELSSNKALKSIHCSHPILPVRSTVHEDETILSYLKNIDKELKINLKNIESYHYFLEKNDLFQSVFSYLLLYKSPKKNFLSKEIEVLPKLYPLVLIISKKSPLELILLYNEAKFTRKSADNLTEHFCVILQKIIEDPEQLVTHYSILTKSEKAELLPNTKKKPPAKSSDAKNMAVHDLFIYQVKKTPHYIAVAYEAQVLTYQQLDHLSNKIAHLLTQKKIRRGDLVAVLMERSPLLIATMLAILKIGAVYVPIDPKYPEEKIEFILQDCNAHFILVNNTQRLPKDLLYKSIVLDATLSAIKHFPEQFPTPQWMPENQFAYVIYTSGTTGQPKGVVIKHTSLVNLVNWYKTCFSITANDRASQFSSPGFDSFFCEVIPFLSVGASIHIVKDSIKFTPTEFLAWLAKEKITLCDLPTSYAQVLFNYPWPDKLSLRLLKVGGEIMAHYPPKKFPFDIWNTYGPAEATIETTFYKVYQAHSHPEDEKAKHALPPIGKPLFNTEVYVVDKHLELAPIESVGELLIGGANLAGGYLNRPQLTQTKFIRHPFKQTEEKLYRTGDLVRRLKDGNLQFIGRIDHQVKISGYRIDLNEIETALNQFPDINEVVVIAKELTHGKKSLIAYLVPNLDRIRIPYQERCLICYDEYHYLQTLTEDISKEGIAITGPTEELHIGESIKLNFKLPGASEAKWLTGKVIWQSEQRAGIHFDRNDKQMALLQKSINYFLTTHNLMETLQGASAKRSLRSALKSKLPKHMIPTIFSTLSQLPLTFNGKVDWNALPPPRDFERILDRSYVEPRNPTETEIYKIWQEILDQEKISITDNFFDLGGNSQLIATLSVKILEKFGISLPEKILFDLPFIPLMAEYIDSRGKEYTYKTSQQDEINRDAILHDDIIPNRVQSPRLSSPQGILLTGVSGFLGVFLLNELLEQTDAKIYCPIRKGKFESIATRLLNNIDRYELTNTISLANRRIVMIQSDISNEQFSMPVDLYNNLANKIEVIYHCGAQVNTVTSYSHLRASNVQGTLETIKFAMQKFDKPIHYISTLATANKFDAHGHLVEDFPDANASQITGGYATSKWVSERLLTQAKNRGLPVCIYRSGYIWGNSETGTANLNDALLLLIKGCIQLGFAPDWKEKITILPVDFVSKAIVGIALLQKEKSNMFHLDHPTGIMWSDLIAWFSNFGYNIKICSHADWLNKLTHISQENALYPFLPRLLAQSEPPDSPIIEMSHATSALEKLNLSYPEINNRLLHLYVKYLCEIGFLPTPENKRKQIYVD